MSVIKIVESLKKLTGADFGGKSSKEDLQKVQQSLEEMGLPELPEEVYSILLEMDGFIWNGMELFSLKEKSVAEKAYEVFDIISANKYFKTKEKDDGLVVFGREDEDIYVYNSQDDIYEIIDRIDWEVMEEFDSLQDLLSYSL